MKIARSGGVLLFLALMCSVPGATFATSQLLISEIHYNPAGVDDKHEYVEVCNVGVTSVDIVGYKLFESGSNRTLTLNRGSSMLGQNVCAVFVTDPATFLVDFPSFSAGLFDASFSLSNTGEALVLRDTNGADVDGISYTSGQGGNGDGTSLHRSGTSFAGGATSPGTEPGLVGTPTGSGGGTGAGTGTGSDTTSGGTETTTNSSSVTVFHTVTIEPPAQLFVRTTPTITTATNSVVLFSAESYNAKGTAEDVQYTWVYGDGLRDASLQSGGKASHVYRHAGEYEAVVTAIKGSLSGEARVRVVVENSPLTLSFIHDESAVQVENTGAIPVDMTGIRLVLGTNTSQTYTFPDKTRILPKKKIILSLADIGLTDLRRPKEVILIPAHGTNKISVRGSEPELAVVATSTNQALAPMTILPFGMRVATEESVMNMHSTGGSVSASTASGSSDLAIGERLNTATALSVKPSTQAVRASAQTKQAPVSIIPKSLAISQPVTVPTEPEPLITAVRNPTTEVQVAAAVHSTTQLSPWLLIAGGVLLLGGGLMASKLLGTATS